MPYGELRRQVERVAGEMVQAMHIHIHSHSVPPALAGEAIAGLSAVEPRSDPLFGEILVHLKLIHERLMSMSKELDDLKAQVAADTAVESSAISLIQGLAARIAASSDNPAALQALTSELNASSTALAAAVTANTPAAAPSTTQPGPSTGGTDTTGGASSGGTDSTGGAASSGTDTTGGAAASGTDTTGGAASGGIAQGSTASPSAPVAGA